MLASPGSQSVFLVAADSATTVQTITRALTPFRPCVTAATVLDAFELLDGEQPVAGIVVDLSFPGVRNGFDIVERARGDQRACPALVLATQFEPEHLERAFDLRATLLVKRDFDARLRRFAFDCIVQDVAGEDSIAQVLRAFAEEHALGGPELEVLHAALHGRRGEWFDSARGVSLPAYRARVEKLLDKTAAADLDMLVRHLLWSAMSDRRASATWAVERREVNTSLHGASR